jgi:hypothetical protein
LNVPGTLLIKEIAYALIDSGFRASDRRLGSDRFVTDAGDSTPAAPLCILAALNRRARLRLVRVL